LSFLSFFFLLHSITSDYTLRAIQHLPEDYVKQAEKITEAFRGDPSFFAYNGEESEPEPEDPEAPPVERFREVHRLAWVVRVSYIELTFSCFSEQLFLLLIVFFSLLFFFLSFRK
jgi:hypothetical protein